MASSSFSCVTALLQALSLTNTLWEQQQQLGIASTFASMTPSIETQPSHRLVQEAELPQARLGSWLAQRAVQIKKACTLVPRPPLSLLQDLPATLLVHTLTFLTPAKPGVKNSYQDKWVDVGAFSLVSRKAYAIARDDAVWRPVCEQLWGSVSDPRLRAYLRVEGWAALFRHMARSSLCIEPGGSRPGVPGNDFRLRWAEDYIIASDLRDTWKNLLFSEWGPLRYECETEESFRESDNEDRDYSIKLLCDYKLTCDQLGGCACWRDAAQQFMDYPALSALKGIEVTALGYASSYHAFLWFSIALECGKYYFFGVG